MAFFMALESKKGKAMKKIKEKLEELEYISDELRKLQTAKFQATQDLVELCIDARAYECFTLNLNKVRVFINQIK